MRDRLLLRGRTRPGGRGRRRARALAVLAAGAAMVALGAASAPVDAQSSAWAGSHFDAPFDADSVTVVRPDVDVSGMFVLTKTTLGEYIIGGSVQARIKAGGYTPPDGCFISPPSAVATDGPSPGDDEDTQPFEATLSFGCNGRYEVIADARSNTSATVFTMIRTLFVEVAPAPVTSVTAVANGDTPQVQVEWEPLPSSARALDADGYVVQRAGPAVDGDYGPFTDLATTPEGGSTTVVDSGIATNGSYRYRVLSARSGPNGQVRADPSRSGVATVQITTAPETTTTTSQPSSSTTVQDTTTTTVASGGTSRPPRSSTTAGGSSSTTTADGDVAAPSTQPGTTSPTTIDTGYEETLDYGDVLKNRVQTTESFADEVPLEGQAVIVEDEGDGMNLTTPIAGALVMLGWAGHFAYLSRLAKQF